MKRTRFEFEPEAVSMEPPLKKPKVDGTDFTGHNEKVSYSILPPEVWREVAHFCSNPDPMSLSAGYFATYPLLTTCKSISKAVAELPLWKFLRELKKVPIKEEEWSVKNGFADFHWNTRVVYGKTFLRMLNTISTRLKQRRMVAELKMLRKSIPALKAIPDNAVVFEAFLDCQPMGITTEYNEFVADARLVTTRFTLNFSANERVTLFFSGSYGEECHQTSLAVVETSPELESFKTADQETLFRMCAEKLKIAEHDFEKQFFYGKILEHFPRDDDYESWVYRDLHPLVQDIEEESYKLDADELPHPAESLLIPVVDALPVTKMLPNMEVMNLINAILRSSLKIGAKQYAQKFIEQNHLEDKLPQNFLDNVSWMFMEWRKESASVFSIRNATESITIRIESAENSFFMEEEGGFNFARAHKKSRSGNLVLAYGKNIDKVQAKCGCDKLSRDMFVSLLLAVGNMDTEDTVFMDQDLKIPLDVVGPYLATADNDGTSFSEENDSTSEDDDEEVHDELEELQAELKGLEEATQKC